MPKNIDDTSCGLRLRSLEQELSGLKNKDRNYYEPVKYLDDKEILLSQYHDDVVKFGDCIRDEVTDLKYNLRDAISDFNYNLKE